MSGWSDLVLRLVDHSGDIAGEQSRKLAEERTRTYAMALLVDAREELVRADQKAAILLAATGVVVGSVLGSLVSGAWPAEGTPVLAQASWWVGAVIALLGAGCFGTAVFPRTRGHRGRSEVVGFYGDIAAYTDEAALRRALETSSAFALERVVSQLREVSLIVARKYLLLRYGIVLFGAAVLCHAAVLVARDVWV